MAFKLLRTYILTKSTLSKRKFTVFSYLFFINMMIIQIVTYRYINEVDFVQRKNALFMAIDVIE